MWRCHISEIYGVFINDVTKCVCVLMIYVCRKCSEINIAGFLGGLLCTSVYGCTFVCSVVGDCIQSGVKRGGLFG